MKSNLSTSNTSNLIMSCGLMSGMRPQYTVRLEIFERINFQKFQYFPKV